MRGGVVIVKKIFIGMLVIEKFDGLYFTRSLLFPAEILFFVFSFLN